ncbi:ImmA/IrrE family metallo-endopeptidase [Hufsiella ginkgonis]|uniref:ImmA/IrrE family metallo-endopeptidase n=1 Tax=Hufsiella ginkgonis TaxID=2695274 RepID=A0A7K1XTJ7_9SPHI|nr:ImmA/IrrE family metallo-endopeptidase [Hufsiella ginkgonis]MXV14343.1 hypothetical protein [Hufsiella ginkgonis]
MRLVRPHIENIAKQFWSVTNLDKEPPYDLSGAISLMFPIDIVQLSQLSTDKIKQWLKQRNVQIDTEVNDRPVHGFVIFYRGAGFIFSDGGDDERERRYTIAHEISHFILDYKIPREKIINKLGASISDVIDGIRPPTDEEIVKGIVHGLNVKPFTHLLEKKGDGSFLNSDVYNSENAADELAIELIAPASRVVADILQGNKPSSFGAFSDRCRLVLENRYKLPGLIANDYARLLAYKVTGGPSIMSRMGF